MDWTRGANELAQLWAARVFPPLQEAGFGTYMIKAAEMMARARSVRWRVEQTLMRKALVRLHVVRGSLDGASQ